MMLSLRPATIILGKVTPLIPCGALVIYVCVLFDSMHLSQMMISFGVWELFLLDT